MNVIRSFCLAFLLCWAGAAAADVPVPPLTGRIVDQTGTLSANDIASLTVTLKDLERRKGSQIAILIVPTTQPETIEQFSIRVAEAWKIGRRRIDDGALIVVAKNDRRLRIEIGYGLEGSLTDATSRRIIDEIITPRFRAGDFAGGISDGLARIVAVIDGEPLPPPVPSPRSSTPGGQDNLDWIGYFLNPFVIVVYLTVGAVLRQILGRLLGAVAAGGVVGVFVWFMVGSVIAAVISGVALFLFTAFADALWSPGAMTRSGRGRRGGWGGSYSGGGWSSGGSSSDSGFSGGGGSFGGGGASGSW